MADSLFRHARRFEMSSQTSADALHLGRVKFFEGAGYAPVQKAPPYRAQFRVGLLPQKVVRVIVAPCAPLPFDDPALPQFLQGARQAVFVPVGGFCQQVEREGPADGGGEPGQLIG